MSRRERGLLELYEDDAERADALIYGRISGPSRRGFLKGAGLSAMQIALGAAIPFADQLPLGFVPTAFAASDTLLVGKEGLQVLNDHPITAEATATGLAPMVTPVGQHYVRNNGSVPERAIKQDLNGWTLTIDGQVERPLQLSMAALKRDFPAVDAQLVLECGGNGRAGYDPKVRGSQWTLGAVGCAQYRGIRLRDVLKKAGVRSDAVYIGYYGEDIHASGDRTKPPISRGVPISKAQDEHTLLVYEMNGAPLPALHGFPLRLLCPGWPGSTSGKWLKRIWVRDQVHDGPKMTGMAYRMPRQPVEPGNTVDPSAMDFIERMPVRSVITTPGNGQSHRHAQALAIRGHAWSGHGAVRNMAVSIDFGQTWSEARLSKPVNAYAWQHWKADLMFPTAGYYEVWARATDSAGFSQPMLVPGWNPKGYLNNACHRISVRVV